MRGHLIGTPPSETNISFENKVYMISMLIGESRSKGGPGRGHEDGVRRGGEGLRGGGRGEPCDAQQRHPPRQQRRRRRQGVGRTHSPPPEPGSRGGGGSLLGATHNNGCDGVTARLPQRINREKWL